MDWETHVVGLHLLPVKKSWNRRCYFCGKKHNTTQTTIQTEIKYEITLLRMYYLLTHDNTNATCHKHGCHDQATDS